MPIGAGVLSAGADIVSTALNGIFQGSANRAERRFARQMYGQQREDALSDWNRQNAYDAPSAQMQRFKDAGLNPLLIYGSGSASAGNAGPIRSSSPGSYSPKAPQVDLGAAIHDYIDVKMKDQQIDNLKEMNKVLFMKQALGGADLLGMQLRNQYLQETLPDREGYMNAMRYKAQMINDQNEKLMPVTLDAAKAHLEQIKAQTTFTMNEDERRAALNAENIKVAVQKVLLMRAQTMMQPSIERKIIHATNLIDEDQLYKEAARNVLNQSTLKDDNSFLNAVEGIVGHILNGVMRKR